VDKMSLEDLYSEIILDYSKNPQFKKIIENAEEYHGHNSSCGDEITLYLNEKDGKILDISFDGHGCIISQASAAMMCEILKGRSVENAKSILENILRMSRGEDYNKEVVEDIEIFEDIKNFPMRVKCFTLSWHTIENFLKNKGADK
jgi:nitrogen fixation NifU-like protein